jgi:hypothetical protein
VLTRRLLFGSESEARYTASMAAEAREGISDDVGWLLWPLLDDSEAIRHGFGDRCF